MTIRTVVQSRTEIRCMAPHPDGTQKERYRHRRHERVLFVLPFRCIPRRVLRHEHDVRPGYIPAWCSRCERFTEYEVVAPVAIVAEPAPAPVAAVA